jgi:hypothetical protein
MYKLSTRLLIVLLTFGIGISSAAGWYYYQESQKTQIILPIAKWEPIFFKTINEATNLAKFTELRKTNLSEGDVEIRVWYGFSGLPLEAVFLKRTNNEWSAQYLKTNNAHEFDKVELRQLNTPKSGWDSFWKKIVDQEILTLQQSVENECDISTIGAINYVVEINQNRTYRTYKYFNGSKCREATQAEEIVNIIGEEFDSDMEQCQRAEWFACTNARIANKRNQ